MSKVKKVLVAYMKLYAINAMLAVMPAVTGIIMVVLSCDYIPDPMLVITIYAFAVMISSTMNMVLVNHIKNLPNMVIGFGIPIISGIIVSLVAISFLSRYAWTIFILIATAASVVVTIGCYTVVGLIWLAARKG